MSFDLPPYLESGLLESGVSAEAIAAARRKAGPDGDFGAQLEAAGAMTREAWAKLAAERLGLRFCADLLSEYVEAQVLGPVSMQYCRR